MIRIIVRRFHSFMGSPQNDVPRVVLNHDWLSIFVVWGLGTVLSVTGCKAPPSSSNSKKSERDKPVVAAVNFPLEYFARRIGGEAIEVVTPIPKDHNAARMPRPDQIRELQEADLILVNGGNFSQWLQTVSLPQDSLVVTSESFEDNYIELEESFVHRHGPQGDRSDKERVSTTWLDLSQARQQADAIRKALIELSPANESTFQANFQKLATELEKLDQQFTEAGRKLKGLKLLAAAPIYHYLARRYGLDIQHLAVFDTNDLSENDLSILQQAATSNLSKWMIWPTQPSESVKMRLETEFGMKSVVIRPCSFQQSGSEDWLKSMIKNLEVLDSLIQ